MSPGEIRGGYYTVAEIKFSQNRDLVVSVLKDRVVIGQRLTFPDDAGKQQKTYLKHSPSLDLASVIELRDALTVAARELERRGGHQGEQAEGEGDQNIMGGDR